MSKVTFGALSLVASLVVLAALGPVGSCEGYGDYRYPGTGTWRITRNTMVADEHVVVNGDIVIEEGARFVLLDSTLVMNCSYPDQYRVVIHAGGEFVMTAGSSIVPMNSTNGYKFVVEKEPSGWTIDPQAGFIVGALVGLGIGFPLGIASTAYYFKRWFSRNLPPPV